MPLDDSKRGKDLFKELVNECISRDILTTEVVRKLSKRARAYICAYYILHQRQQQVDLPLIDRLMKIFKTHRAALDFDAGFVESVIPKAIEDVVKLAMNRE
jgi:signal transduction protein with GAF and PtsI domain